MTQPPIIPGSPEPPEPQPTPPPQIVYVQAPSSDQIARGVSKGIGNVAYKVVYVYAIIVLAMVLCCLGVVVIGVSSGSH